MKLNSMFDRSGLSFRRKKTKQSEEDPSPIHRFGSMSSKPKISIPKSITVKIDVSSKKSSIQSKPSDRPNLDIPPISVSEQADTGTKPSGGDQTEKAGFDQNAPKVNVQEQALLAFPANKVSGFPTIQEGGSAEVSEAVSSDSRSKGVPGAGNQNQGCSRIDEQEELQSPTV